MQIEFNNRRYLVEKRRDTAWLLPVRKEDGGVVRLEKELIASLITSGRIKEVEVG